jgi:dTMP kinase
MSKGKFIVIDGTDGSGKATQTALLENRLKKDGYKVKKIDFPRYYNNFFGKLIGECLAGDYGDFISLNPHIASVLYAADRFESSPDIKKWLAYGYIVLSDRYVSSNQIHQGGKISNPAKRKEFLRWLDKMEYGVFDIPKPNLIIFLDVPISVTQKLLKLKDQVVKKKYLKGKKDQAENNLVHLEKSRANAISIVKKANHWKKINCTERDELLSKEKIHDLVYQRIKKLLNNPCLSSRA